MRDRFDSRRLDPRLDSNTAPHPLVDAVLILSFLAGYATVKWAIKDNALRNSKAGHIQGLFP